MWFLKKRLVTDTSVALEFAKKRECVDEVGDCSRGGQSGSRGALYLTAMPGISRQSAAWASQRCQRVLLKRSRKDPDSER